MKSIGLVYLTKNGMFKVKKTHIGMVIITDGKTVMLLPTLILPGNGLKTIMEIMICMMENGLDHLLGKILLKNMSKLPFYLKLKNLKLSLSSKNLDLNLKKLLLKKTLNKEAAQGPPLAKNLNKVNKEAAQGPHLAKNLNKVNKEAAQVHHRV